MRLDELFEEYKKKKAEADDLLSLVNEKEAEANKLLNLIAEEAQGFCMSTGYWNRKFSFHKSIPQDEALSVFGDTFMECVKKGLEGKTERLSGALWFYFPKRLSDYRRKEKKVPKPLSALPEDPEAQSEDPSDSLIRRIKGDQSADAASGAYAKDLMHVYLDALEAFPKFQRDALILNVSGVSHYDIAHFLSVEKQKVNKGKYDARQKLRKILHEKE